MKLSSKLRIISYLLNLCIYFVVITLYAEIFDNYLKIIPIAIHNDANNTFFVHFIIGYINFLVIFIIPVLFVWLLNLIFVLIAKRTFTNVFVMWLFKRLIITETDEKKNNDLKANMNQNITNNNNQDNNNQIQIMQDTSPQKIDMDKFNYNSIKQGNVVDFLILSLLHILFWLPFVGWFLALIYFIWTIILQKKNPFVNRFVKMSVKVR